MAHDIDEMYKDKNWLIEQYWGFNLSLVELGELVGRTNVCIAYWIDKHNIPTRHQFQHLKWLNQDKEHQSKAGKARAKWTNDHYSHLAKERMLKNNPGYITHTKWKKRDPEGYRQHQVNAAKKAGEIMRERLTDWDFLKKHGYLKSQYPYPPEFNRELKKQVFDRDKGICQLCCNTITNGHAIHHIDYDKNNNIESNLILLCDSCHSKTNVKNRKYWTKLFSSKMERFYDS